MAAMSLDATQLRQMVIKPALEKLGLWSTAAEELVLGAASIGYLFDLLDAKRLRLSII